MTLPKDAAERKALPIYSGFVQYFPDAMIAVAELSRIGNEQHNPGKPLHWDRSKSGDEKDALMRHLLDAGTTDSDGVRHSTKVAWRAMANLQKEIEEDGANDLDDLRNRARAAGIDVKLILPGVVAHPRYTIALSPNPRDHPAKEGYSCWMVHDNGQPMGGMRAWSGPDAESKSKAQGMADDLNGISSEKVGGGDGSFPEAESKAWADELGDW